MKSVRTLQCAILVCGLLTETIAFWTVEEDISVARSKIRFEEYSNTWNLDLHASTHFSLVIPQICVAAHESECIVRESNIAPRKCADLANLWRDPIWRNENLKNDQSGDACPASFQDMSNAQLVLGSVLMQPLIYISTPFGLVIHNSPNATKYAYHDSHAGVNHTAVFIRLLFVTDFSWAYTVHEEVMRIELVQPHWGDILASEIKTFTVQGVCRADGLVSPPFSRLELEPDRRYPENADLAYCSIKCLWHRLRIPWNTPPTRNITSSCPLLPRHFTAIEFGFDLVSGMLSSSENHFSQVFFDALNDFALTLELKLGEGAIVALTVPHSRYDDESWEYIVKRHVAMTYEPKLLYDTKNDSLVLQALQSTGLYQEIQNQDYVYDLRRKVMQEILIKGLVILPDTSSSIASYNKLLQDAVRLEAHEWPSDVNVLAIANVDLRRVHLVHEPMRVSVATEALRQTANVTVWILSLIACCLTVGYVLCCSEAKVAPRKQKQDPDSDSDIEEEKKQTKQDHVL